MGDLSNKFIDESYGSLLHTTEDTGLSGTTKSVIQDGKGTDTALKVSTNKVDVNGDLQTGGVDRITSTGDLVNVSGNISQFTNDSGFISTIPPTYLESGDNISELTNDVGYLTTLPSNVMVEGENVSLLNNDSGYITSIPTTYLQSGDNISELTNDSGYLTSIPANVMVEGENISLLNNDSGYISSIPTTYLQSGDNVSELVNDNNYLSGASGLVSTGINIKNTDPSTNSSINFNPGSIGIDAPTTTTSNNLQVNGAQIDITGASGSFQDIYLKHPTWTPNDATRASGGQYLNFTDASGAGFNGYIGLNRFGQMQFINPQANFSSGQRFVFQGATAGSGEIYVGGFNTTKNSANWQTAYDETITGMTTIASDLVLTKRDGSTIQTTLPGGGGGGGYNLTAQQGLNYGPHWGYYSPGGGPGAYGRKLIGFCAYVPDGEYRYFHHWVRTAASTTGAVYDMGIYNIDPTTQAGSALYGFKPTTLVASATGVDATTTGQKLVTLSTPVTLTAGVYFFAFRFDNGVDNNLEGTYAGMPIGDGQILSMLPQSLGVPTFFGSSGTYESTSAMINNSFITSLPSDVSSESWSSTSYRISWGLRC